MKSPLIALLASLSLCCTLAHADDQPIFGLHEQVRVPDQFAQRVVPNAGISLRAAALLQLLQQIRALILKAGGELADVVQRQPKGQPVERCRCIDLQPRGDPVQQGRLPLQQGSAGGRNVETMEGEQVKPRLALSGWAGLAPIAVCACLLLLHVSP